MAVSFACYRAHTEGVKTYDAVVVGGGVVGLSVARELAVAGQKVVVLEKEHALVTGASGGNSGLGCTGYDAPEGSLERRLLRRSIQRHPNLYRSLGLSYEHVSKCGSLVVAWTPEQLKALPGILKENHEIGDAEVKLLSQGELRALEPSLSHAALGAVYVPREMIAEPWLVPIAFAESARLHGADIRLGTELLGATQGSDKLWTLRLSQGLPLSSHVVINCAGLHGDEVEALHRKKAPFVITPRKGEFVVFKTDVPLSRVIEPVPTQFTKGVIVWTTVYGNVVVGPTADPQTSKTDRSNNQDTIARLLKFGESVLPGLKSAEIIGTYSGLRPATEFRDYQIEALTEKNWITVGGIRSTGLTAASGIGEYVAELYFQMRNGQPGKGKGTHAAPVLSPPYRPASLPEPPMFNASIPSLADLSADFRARQDGTVQVFDRVHRVTHPLSALGMANFNPEHARSLPP
jgi:glycerol-3-phosphate dehydrogenase